MKKTRSLVSVTLLLAMVLSLFALPAGATTAVTESTTSDVTEPYEAPAPAPITDITNEDGSPVKVACIGDSITYGTGIDEIDREVYSYPAMLGSMLGDGYEVGNFGRGGSYILPADSEYNLRADKTLSYRDTQQHLDSIAFAPNVVIIMLGTNDVASFVDAESAAVIEEELENIIKIYQALESVKRVYVMTSIFGPYSYSMVKASDGPLQKIQQRAAEDTGAEFVDIYSLTRDYFDVMLHLSDRLHPDEDSYNAIPTAAYALLTGTQYTPLDMPKAESGVVYVSSKGALTNDGLTPDTPINSLPLAAGMLREDGGTIVICGAYSCYVKNGTHMPKTNGTIKITSKYGGIDYAETNGARMEMNSTYLYLGGDMVFDDICLYSSSNSMIMCNYNNVTFEKGVNCVAETGIQNPVIVAGYNIANGSATVEQVSFKGNCTITVNGGTWHYVRNGNRRHSVTSAVGVIEKGSSVKFIINGGIFESTDANNNISATGMNGVMGDCSLIINGGSFSGKIYAVNRVGTLSGGQECIVSGNITVAVNNGMIRDSVIAVHPSAANVNCDDASINLVVSKRYSESMSAFDGFDNVETVDNDIVIDSADEVISLMADASAWDGYYVLTKDIDLSDAGAQNCIGNDTVPFTGCFDGSGFTISGIDVKGDLSTGFFGTIRGADIRNLTVNGKAESTYAAADAEASESIGYVATGLLVGKVSANSNVTNCKAYGTTKGNGNVGGMFGMLRHVGEGMVKISFCDNYAVPENTAGNTGGLVSRIEANAHIINSLAIVDSNNYADISSVSLDRCRVAGICAYGYNYDKVVIARCNNYGDISGVNAGVSVNSATYVGGISGRMECEGSADAAYEIIDCLNYGDITSTYVCGGIVGYIHHQSVVTGQSEITSCGNEGSVTVTGDNACVKYAGGIAALTNSGTRISLCYNRGSVTSSSSTTKTKYASGILGYTNNATETNGSISNSANYGAITVEGNGTLCAGGIIGEQLRYDLVNCYNSGKINSAVIKYIGAISGVDKAGASFADTNCYALEGSASNLVGTARANCTKTNVAFVSADAALTKDSYAGFDFTDIWTVKDGTLKLDCYTTEASGDIDADGILTNADIALAIRYLSGWDIEYRANRFDLNADGKLSNRDAVMLIKALAQDEESTDD